MLKRAEVWASRRRVLRRGPSLADRPRAGEAAGADGLEQVDHIVILMMENHSYDNYLGMLTGHGDGFELGADGLPTATNPRGGAKGASSELVGLTHPGTTVQAKDVPTQSWAACHIQWNDGACDGFVASIEKTLPDEDPAAGMTYWTEADLPFYYGLARTFPLATRWFSSCLGPTFPNRRFMIAGTAHGLIDDLPFGMIDYPPRGTIFDLLTAHEITWANYHKLSGLRTSWRRLSHARGLNFLRPLAGVLAAVNPAWIPRLVAKLQATADLYPLGFLRSVNHLRSMDEFWRDARLGTLPSVSIVDPDFKACSEENPQDIAAGEAFAAEVINAVMAGPAWPGTLLLWLYDEHGGYYDHMQPPAAVPPDDVEGVSSFDRFWVLRLLRNTSIGRRVAVANDGPATYDRLGFRVPAVIVSPYARPGFVTEQVYDHTSVLKLIERKWNLPPLTSRDAAAADPLEALDFDSPPHFLTPPQLPEPGLKRHG
jgi:phospholipase C